MNPLIIAAADQDKRRRGRSPLGGQLIAGNSTLGFYGEISAEDFITVPALTTMVELTAGLPRNTASGWLKFSRQGKTIYVAKLPFRSSVSWDQLNARNVITGSRLLTIQNKIYKVRLLKGFSVSTPTADVGFDLPQTHNSEWNELMYHVSGLPFGSAGATLASEGIEEGDFTQYSESDLGFGSASIYGYHTWVQEKNASGNAFVRGGSGSSYQSHASPNNTNGAMGWRPVLELVE